MLKVYYCEDCDRIFYISRKGDGCCNKCSKKLLKIDMSYSHFTALSMEDRKQVIRRNLNGFKE